MKSTRTIGGILIFCAMLLGFNSIQSQDKNEWWNLTDWGLDYQLPKKWSSDPFNSSSVCNCPGTINDNGEWFSDEGNKYLGMVIYPVNKAERDTSTSRQQVWGYGFVPQESSEEISYAGISYTATYGSFPGMKGWPKVWQLVSNDEISNKYVHFVIYFWGHEKVFNKNIDTFKAILESFQRTKVRTY